MRLFGRRKARVDRIRSRLFCFLIIAISFLVFNLVGTSFADTTYTDLLSLVEDGTIDITVENYTDDRGGRSSLGVNFRIDYAKMELARSGHWIYDLSSVIADSPVKDFPGVEDVPFYNNGVQRGTYSIIDNKVYFDIDSDWLDSIGTSVNCSFDFDMEFDDRKVGKSTIVYIILPGTTEPIPYTFSDPNINMVKTVDCGAASWSNRCNNGEGVSNDGTIQYRIQLTPNYYSDSDTIHVVDVLNDFPDGATYGNEVTLVTGEGTIDLSNEVSISNDGKSMSLTISNVGMPSNENSYILYTVTIDPSDFNKILNNQATIHYDDKTGTSSVDLFPEDITLSKAYNLVSENGNQYIDWEITVGKNGDDLSEIDIWDTMLIEYQKAVSDIKIYNKYGVLVDEVASSAASQTYANHTNYAANVFDYSFSEIGGNEAPYTIKYRTLVRNEAGVFASENTLNICNYARVGDWSRQLSIDVANACVSEDLDVLNGNIEKEFLEFDSDTRTAEWKITATLDDDRLVEPINIDDYITLNVLNAYSTVHFDNINYEVVSVTAGGTPISYTVSYNGEGENKRIVITPNEVVSHGVIEIIIKTELPEDLDYSNVVYEIHNYTAINYDEVALKSTTATGTTEEEGTSVIDKTVSVNASNPNQLDYLITIDINDDRTYQIVDYLPDGMQPTPLTRCTQWYAPVPGCEYAMLIGGAFAEYFSDDNYFVLTDIRRPDGYEGTYIYQVRYSAVIVDIPSGVLSKEFINRVTLYGDEYVDQDDATFVWKNDEALQKTDDSEEQLTAGDYIQYHIVVNENGEVLNAEGDMILTDTLDGNSEMDVSSITTSCDATISYDDVNGVISLIIPDGVRCEIGYRAKALSDGAYYTNTVVLSGTTGETGETVRKWHFLSGSAIIWEDNDVTLKLLKLDQDKPNDGLDGAKFRLYQELLDNSYSITNEVNLGERTTSNGGEIIYDSLVNNTLYCLAETQPKQGYLIGDNATKKCFIIYSIGDTSNEEEINRTTAESLKDNIVAANEISSSAITVVSDGYTHTAFNEKAEQQTGGVSITKSVRGTLGNRNQEFGLSVTLKDSENNPITDLTYNVDGNANTTMTGASQSGVFSFSITHGQNINIIDLPVGSTFTIVETGDYDGYEVSYEYNETTYTNGSSGVTGTIANQEYPLVTIINTKNGTIPLGDNERNPIAFIVVGVGIAAAGLWIYKRRRMMCERNE